MSTKAVLIAEANIIVDLPTYRKNPDARISAIDVHPLSNTMQETIIKNGLIRQIY